MQTFYTMQTLWPLSRWPPSHCQRSTKSFCSSNNQQFAKYTAKVNQKKLLRLPAITSCKIRSLSAEDPVKMSKNTLYS
jgi:hypothetical protein